MSDLIAQPWFWSAAIIIVGLPVVLLVLGELHTALVRRGSPGTRLVLLIRNVLAPLGAILLLFTLIPTPDPSGFTWAKVVATAFGFVVLLVLLNGLNLAVFVTAKRGTWRDRLPSIFVDIARVLLIVIGLAILFGWIWGADIGGLFTALGISTIVIGLALQNAVGAVLSGLFLLFEQPFELGDYLDTGSGKGRIVAVNWRATHIDTGNGILVIPNGTLAGATFRNLSRATNPYEAATTVKFSTDDPPQEVIDLLVEVARGLPALAVGSDPSVVPLDDAQYEVRIPLTAPSLEYRTLGVFRTRLWYAARRAGIHLDGDLTDSFATPERTLETLRRVAPNLHIPAKAVAALADRVQLERFGEGEVMQHESAVPDATRIIISGVVELTIAGSKGAQLTVTRLATDDMVGLTALTRQAVSTTATALVDVAVLKFPVDVVDELVKASPALAKDIGTAIDHRQQLARKVRTAAGDDGATDPLMVA